MGRNAKVRESYTRDAIALERLRDAVKADVKQSEAWRNEVSNHLEKAVRLLLTPKPNGY